MTLIRPLLVGIALVSFFLAGCSGPRPGGVTATVVDVHPINATLLESRATLTLRYTNENISPLGFSGSKHKLYLNGSFVGTAVSDKAFGVPPLSTVTQDVIINLENLSLVRQLVAMGNSQTAAYRLESVLYQTIGEDRYDIKTRSDGALDLRALAGSAQ